MYTDILGFTGISYNFLEIILEYLVYWDTLEYPRSEVSNTRPAGCI